MADILPAERVDLDSDSVYANATTYYDSENQAVFLTRNADVFASAYVITDDETLHTVVSGDNCKRLARIYYGRFTQNPENFYWYISDLNGIPDFLDLESLIGQEIVIPNWSRAQLLF